MIVYPVTIKYIATVTQYVEASSQEEALKIAEQLIDKISIDECADEITGTVVVDE